MSNDRQDVVIVVLGVVPEVEAFETHPIADPEDYAPRIVGLLSADRLEEALQKEPVDLVLFTPDVADTSASEVIALSRRWAPFASVVMVAAPEQAAEVVSAGEDGLDGYFIRHACPEFDGALLAQTVNRILRSRHTASAEFASFVSTEDLAIYNGQEEPFLIIDRDYRLRYGNRALHDLDRDNYGRALRVGEDIYPLIPEAHRPNFDVNFDAAIRGKRHKIQDNIETVAGPHSWHEYIYAPVYDRSGEAVAISVLIRQISEQEQVQDLLRESEARFWTLFENFQFGMAVIHRDGCFAHVNPALEEMLCRSREELLGTPMMAVTYHEDHETCKDMLQDMITGRRTHVSFEKRYVRKDGRLVWCDAAGWAVYGRDGEMEYVVIVLVDITARKRLQEQTQHVERMRAVGQLAAGIAHEFNNIFSAIVGFADLAYEEMKEKGESGIQRDLEKVMALCERGGVLTQDLLTYSRPQVVKTEILDLNSIVEQISQMLGTLFDPMIRTELDLAPSLPPIKASRSHIEQVLMNLAMNARDAMPDGGRLRIRTFHDHVDHIDLSEAGPRARLKVGDYVVMEVADTGQGMEPSVIDQIFEPFFSTKEVGQGTGLGLPSAYGILRDLGGAIGVESEPGQGTCFTLYIPAST
ncbi:MAG: PAS domain S-box protein [Bradymonadaceae bacterium]